MHLTAFWAGTVASSRGHRGVECPHWVDRWLRGALSQECDQKTKYQCSPPEQLKKQACQTSVVPWPFLQIVLIIKASMPGTSPGFSRLWLFSFSPGGTGAHPFPSWVSSPSFSLNQKIAGGAWTPYDSTTDPFDFCAPHDSFLSFLPSLSSSQFSEQDPPSIPPEVSPASELGALGPPPFPRLLLHLPPGPFLMACPDGRWLLDKCPSLYHPFRAVHRRDSRHVAFFLFFFLLQLPAGLDQEILSGPAVLNRTFCYDGNGLRQYGTSKCPQAPLDVVALVPHSGGHCSASCC